MSAGLDYLANTWAVVDNFDLHCNLLAGAHCTGVALARCNAAVADTLAHHSHQEGRQTVVEGTAAGPGNVGLDTADLHNLRCHTGYVDGFHSSREEHHRHREPDRNRAVADLERGNQGSLLAFQGRRMAGWDHEAAGQTAAVDLVAAVGAEGVVMMGAKADTAGVVDCVDVASAVMESRSPVIEVALVGSDAFDRVDSSHHILVVDMTRLKR